MEPGRILGEKYRVEEFVGGGWEGEVYRVVETRTRVTRAAKLFYPERNPGNRTVARYARHLEKLRDCPITLKYHHSEAVCLETRKVTCLISEFAAGRRLSELARNRRGQQLEPFEALHLLHAVALGLEAVHAARLYHGDLHSDNVLVRRVGIKLDVKVFDFFHRGRCNRENQQEDIIDAVHLIYEVLGGPRRYASLPPEIKWICCGLKRGLILRRFPTASRLRRHLETFCWSDG